MSFSIIRSRFGSLAVGLCAWFGMVDSGAADPIFGQVDDFEDVGIQDWARGSQILGGGPLGAGDDFLQYTSSGTTGSNSRMATFNQAARWAGDYLGAGITRIEADVNNLGATPLQLRVAFGDVSAPSGGGTWYVSAASVDVAPGSGWQSVTFPLDPGALVDVQGASSYPAILSNVTTFRILSSTSPAARGDTIAATLGIDNITAVPEPSSALLLLLAAAVTWRRCYVA